MKYTDRRHAGIVLADLLQPYSNRSDVIILALPRGGVPVAYEIAMKLSVMLDVFLVRKLGVPEHEELAMGAIASGGITVLNEEIVQSLHINQKSIDAVKQSEQQELIRREHLYRGDFVFPTISGHTIILVDDGLATGSTMKAAILALQQKSPFEIVVAIPVAARSTCDEIASMVSRMVCPLQPTNFYAVGFWYDAFPQTTDEEVISLLENAKQHQST